MDLNTLQDDASYLFFDTETTGLPDYKLAIEDPAQPYIIQLGMILTDASGREMRTFKAPIITPGLVIDENSEAFKVNGLTMADVNKYGVTVEEALKTFEEYENLATMKIAYGYRFDGFLTKVAFHRAGLKQRENPIDKYCAMKGYSDAKGTKYAKLINAVQECTGKPLEKAHDALADVRGAKDVFFWLKNEGHYKPQPRFVPETKEAANG